jgi:hypothetical protein
VKDENFRQNQLILLFFGALEAINFHAGLVWVGSPLISAVAFCQMNLGFNEVKNLEGDF